MNIAKNLKKSTVPQRSERSDGLETRSHIITCAGDLIAGQGYAKTSCKEICARAQVNPAAINYHFGSREGLYVAVLEEVQNYLVNIQVLNDLSDSPLPPRQKLEKFLDLFEEAAFQKNDWHVKVWAREILTPSPFIQKVISSKALPKINVLIGIFSQYTGLSTKDDRLYSCITCSMAPFLLIFITLNNQAVNQMLPDNYPLPGLVRHYRQFIFAGLDEFARQVQKEKGL